MSLLHRLQSLFRLARSVQARTGKTIFGQAAEILRLRLGDGRLGASEYYDFHLWDDAQLTAVEKSEFAGVRAQDAIEDLTIDDYSKILSLDKLTFHALMHANGFRVPRVQAVLHEGGRHLDIAPVFRSPADLCAFLREGIEYPFFCKPSYGAFGSANLHVNSIDRGADELVLAGGRRVPVDAFPQQLPDRGGFGWMLQEVLHPHGAIRERCGDRVCGLRLQILLTLSGPRLFRSVWKIATADNPFDNYHKGREGNMLAAVDRNTGRVTQIVGGLVPNQHELCCHPDTGVDLRGFVIPAWEEVVDTVIRASTLFPGFLVQGWDVAICEEGPVLLECNWCGDLDLSQFAWRKGFGDVEFREFLRERGLERLLKGRPGRHRLNPSNGRYGRRKAHWPY